MTSTTNYANTLITVAPDCPVEAAVVPSKPGSVALQHYESVIADPYKCTSDDVLFAVFAARNGVESAELETARGQFFSKPQACLRASPLAKKFGWGIHHDAQGRIAIYAVESEEYQRLLRDDTIKHVPAMRSKRA